MSHYFQQKLPASDLAGPAPSLKAAVATEAFTTEVQMCGPRTSPTSWGILRAVVQKAHL